MDLSINYTLMLHRVKPGGGGNPKKPNVTRQIFRIGLGFFGFNWVLLGLFGFFWVLLGLFNVKTCINVLKTQTKSFLNKLKHKEIIYNVTLCNFGAIPAYLVGS